MRKEDITKTVVIGVALFSFHPLYAQLTVDTDTIDNPDVYTGVSLEEVIVTGKEKNLSSRGLGNMQINMNQVRNSPLVLGERDVIKTLQFLPGISAGMEGSSQLNIRGGTADQTLYLVDGAPIYNQNHGFGFFSMFNAEAIKSVNLYKGGIPTMYGDKLSGVVSLDLKEGGMKEHHGMFSIGLLTWALAANGPIIKNKLSYMVAARRSFPDLLYHGGAALINAKSKEIALPVFYDINAKLLWQMNDKSKLSWQIYSGYDDMVALNEYKYTETEEKSKVGYGWRTTTTSLRYDRKLTPRRSLTALAYYTNLNNFNYQQSAFKEQGYKSDIRNVISSKLSEYGAKVWIEESLNNKHKLQYGLETSIRRYMPTHTSRKVNGKKVEYDNGSLKLITVSGYIHDQFEYKGWLFDVGLRTSYFNNGKKGKLTFEPRIKANRFIGEKNKIMFAYDRMYQPVHTVNEMNYNIQSDFWIPFQETRLANSHQFSVGWKNYTTSDLNFSVEAYYKRMGNLLLIRNLENYIDFHMDYESGKGSSYGAEFMMEYNKNRLNAWMSYTISKSDRTFGGRTYPFKYDALHDISAYAGYVVHQRGKVKNTLSVNLQYKSGYPYIVPGISYPGIGLPTQPGAYPDFKDINSVDYISPYPNIKLKDFFRMDVNFTMEKKAKRGSKIWQFSLLNATGRNNPYSVYKQKGKYKALNLIPVLPSVSYTRTF